MNRRHRFFVTAIGIAALVAAPALPAAADETPPPAGQAGDGSALLVQPALAARQDRLMQLRTWIITQPGIEDTGYIESVNDAADLSTTVLWYGPASALQDGIRKEAKRLGVSVTFKQRKYSRGQLIAAATAAFHSSGKGALAGFTLHSVGAIAADFDGIVIRGDQAGAPAAGRAALDASTAGAISAQLGVDVSITSDSGPLVAATATRDSDSPAFNAGGLMSSPSTTSFCTSGFGIILNGVARTTTARHCWQHDYKTVYSGYTYGDGLVNSPEGAARVMTAGGFYWMFDGAWNNTAGYKKTVIGYGDVGLNDLVCTSGANSGVRCNIKVTNMWVLHNDGMGADFWTIEGHQQNDTIAATQGDSGGPVFTTVGDTQVRATGMIQAVQKTWTNCVGVRLGTADIYCSSWVYFSSMRTINNSLGATLRTG
ncbi:hypothetical protein [Dactylosporangium salmoneum]|uniref:Serine protease n=1 Tax=Dactylosporangium salmoneum TaxID=53361 RepID=A0ABP5UHE8_9ACTN